MNAHDPSSDRPPGTLEAIQRLTKDLRQAARTLSAREARYLVDAYYQLQEYRIAAAAQIRSVQETGEPHDTLNWLFSNFELLERNIKTALGAYSQASRVGQWAESITGIGPVISAGLLAHVDIERGDKLPGCNCETDEGRRERVRKQRKLQATDPICGGHPVRTVGHIWRFAGLDPTVTWEKGQKRPWNASLKVLCWKIGESFVKVSGRESDVYGKLYLQRKAQEVTKNDAGDFADQAKAKLARFKIGKTTEAYGHYSAGHLPPAHVHARAKRWAVKLFLAHWHHVAFWCQFGEAPPKPYVLSQLGHGHEIQVPNWSEA